MWIRTGSSWKWVRPDWDTRSLVHLKVRVFLFEQGSGKPSKVSQSLLFTGTGLAHLFEFWVVIRWKNFRGRALWFETDIKLWNESLWSYWSWSAYCSSAAYCSTAFIAYKGLLFGVPIFFLKLISIKISAVSVKGVVVIEHLIENTYRLKPSGANRHLAQWNSAKNSAAPSP